MENADNILTLVEADLKRLDYPYALEYFKFHHNRFGYIIKNLADLKKTIAVNNPRLLEVGSFVGCICIAGNYLGYDACGIDLEHFISKINLTKPGLEYKICNLKTDPIPYADESFDIIVLSEVLEHLDFHPLDLFKEMFRVLKRGGQLIITTPNLLRLNSRIKLLIGKNILDLESGRHYREFSLNEVLRLADEAGLKCDKKYRSCFAYFDYPEGNAIIKTVNKILSKIFPGLSGNLFVVAYKN